MGNVQRLNSLSGDSAVLHGNPAGGLEIGGGITWPVKGHFLRTQIQVDCIHCTSVLGKGFFS